MITADEHDIAYKNLNAEVKQRKLQLCIDRFGACPNYKGHFDVTSFWVGVLLGASSMLLFAIVLVHFFQ